MSKRVVGMVGLIAALAVAGCASEDWQSKYEEQQKLNLDLSGQNDELKRQRAETAAQAEQLAQQAKQSDQEALKVRKEKDDAEKRAAALAAELNKSRSQEPSVASAPSAAAPAAEDKAVRAAADDIQKQNPSTKVSVTKDGNIEITLHSDVTFPTGSADLSEAGKKSLKALTPVLAQGVFAPYHIRVEGHTDATPVVHGKQKYGDNFGLGSARSLAVVRYMETELKIDPKRLMSASCGEHDPVADNKTDAGKKQNRRVEIIVIIPHDAAVSLAK